MCEKPESVDFVSPSRQHRSVNGTKLTMAREAAGLTQAQLAELVARVLLRASLSRRYICEIERPGENEVRVEIAQALQEVLISAKREVITSLI